MVILIRVYQNNYFFLTTTKNYIISNPTQRYHLDKEVYQANKKYRENFLNHHLNQI